MTHKVYPFITCEFLIRLQSAAHLNRWCHLRRSSQNATLSPRLCGTRLSAHSWRAGSPEATIPPSSLPSLPSCRPRVLSFRFRGLHHSSASWPPPRFGPFNHIWRSHTRVNVRTPQRHTNTDTHAHTSTHTAIMGSRHPRQIHTGFVASVGILWLVRAEDSGGFPAALQRLRSSRSISLFLPLSFPLFFSLPPLFPLCPHPPAVPARPQGQKYPVV